MKKNLLIIILLILAIFLFFIIVIFNFSTKNLSPENKNENLVEIGEINTVLVQIKEAEKELDGLRELAEDQESLAKIDLLFEKIEAYKKELKKPRQEIKKETIEDFYNSGFWEEILDLKNKIESTKKSDPTQK